MAGADAAAFVLWPPAGQLATTWPGFGPGLPGHSKGTGQGHLVPTLTGLVFFLTTLSPLIHSCHIGPF